jgi:ribosomal-protein-alanine N-acetyltransferase
MRWWHVAEVMVLERELFEAETWSEESFWSELAETDTRHYVVAVDGGRLLGYAGLAVFSDEAHVLTLGVTRAAQGRGIGTALLRDLLDVAQARGVRQVLLDVRADNATAQRLYARHGFRPVGLRRRYYQPSGTDAVVMARG